jgi:hypothetical protein
MSQNDQILHDQELDAAVADLKGCRLNRLSPIVLSPKPDKNKTQPLQVGPPQVTLEMIYNAILSLGRAVSELKPKDFEG